MSVRLRPHHRLGSDCSGCPWAVLDHDRLFQTLRQLLPIKPNQDIARSPRRKWDDEVDRSRRIALSPSKVSKGGEYGSERRRRRAKKDSSVHRPTPVRLPTGTKSQIERS